MIMNRPYITPQMSVVSLTMESSLLVDSIRIYDEEISSNAMIKQEYDATIPPRHYNVWDDDWSKQ